MSVEKVASAYAAAFELNELDRVRAEYGVGGQMPPGFAEAFVASEKRASLVNLAADTAVAGRNLASWGRGMNVAGRLGKGEAPGVLGGAKEWLGARAQDAGKFIAANPEKAMAGGAAAVGGAAVGGAGLLGGAALANR